MSVDLRNFVQVNINYHEAKPLNRTRDTVVLFTLNIDDNAPQDRLNFHIPENGSTPVDYYTSLADYEYAIKQYNSELPEGESEIVDTKTNPVLYKYISCFFSNGGVKLKIIGASDEEDLSDDTKKVAWILAEVCKLKAEQIVITSDCSESIMRAVASSNATTNIMGNAINTSTSVPTLNGYNEKIFVSSTTDESLVIDNKDSLTNYVIKFGPAGIEMTVGAYLSQVNINDSRTIQDYCYTIEDVSMFEDAIQNDNDKVVALTGKDFNLVTTLVNNNRNIMGDTVAGLDLINYYIRIILTQTLTDRIINTLVTKIKYDRTGINKVINAMTQELNLYKTNGYLNSEFIWTDEDLFYSFNGEDYLVCSRNTPLKMGYKFIVLPITALTQEQRDKHVFPPVYVLIADSQSIRQLVINGDVY